VKALTLDFGIWNLDLWNDSVLILDFGSEVLDWQKSKINQLGFSILLPQPIGAAVR